MMPGRMSMPGGGGLSKGMLTRFRLIPMLASLGPMLLNPYVLGAIAVGGLAWWLLSGDESEETKWRKSTRNKKPMPKYATGVVDVKKDHLAMIHEGEVVLDNKAALDFKEGAKVLGGIASHAKGLAGPLGDKKTGAELRAEAEREMSIERYAKNTFNQKSR